MADDPKTKYPLPKFHFQVDWGEVRMGFTEVSGLDFETQAIDYREGSSLVYSTTKQPGIQKWSNISLKRGTFLGDFKYFELWEKTVKFQEGSQKYRRNVTISLLDEDHKIIISWTLTNAWPTKIQSTNLKADANEIAIETMDLVHEGLTIVQAQKI
jgi:phage tail-like protein